MRLAEGFVPVADRNACCSFVRPSVGRRRIALAGTALVGALTLIFPANAQQPRADIGKRIESAFAVVLGNSTELAIPLTRRALARRGMKKEQRPMEPALAYARVYPALDPPSSDQRPAKVTTENVKGIGSIESEAQGAALARLPRPRPEPEQSVEDAVGGPLDLVAGAADPAVEEVVATAAPPAVGAVSEVEADISPMQAAEGVAPQPSGPPSEAAPPDKAELVASGSCLSPTEAGDKDGDFVRNAETLSGSGFCVEVDTFKERRRPWRIETVKTGRPGPLFAVMHDDENMSFDNAVAALKTYGGTLVAVDTGGKRNQDGIDPNRNFSAGGVGCSKLGKDASPKYTGVFSDLLDSSQPIIALHNNTGKRIPTGGVGHVSMDDVPKDMEAHASNDKKGPLTGDRTLVLLTSPIPVSTTSKAEATELSAKGINVMIEKIGDGKGDCSFSNYTLLTGHPDYLNVTVDDDERDKQKKIIDVIMAGRNDTVATQ